MVGIYFGHSLKDADRRTLVFGGALVVNARSEETLALCKHAAGMIEEAFAPHEPQRAQFQMSVEEFVQRAGPLKSRFTNDRRTKDLVRDVLAGAGCDLRDTYFDVPRLRIVPHGDYLTSGVSYAYKAHRDIWYSSPTAQVNWWTPVFTITPERAMSFFPEYWDKPLANSSSDFDYAEWCAVGRRDAVNQTKTDTRKHPLPKEPASTASELRIAGTMGDVILFSSSHLHATAPNVSGVTRFSIDFRTVSLSDLRGGGGAPNIDCKATGTTLGDFLRGDDYCPIEDIAALQPNNAA